MPIDLSATLHERCLEQVVNEITSLSLTAGSPPGPIYGVYARNVPPDSGHQMPCIVCTIDGEQEEELDGNYLQIEVIYPVRVYILDRSTLDNPDPSARKAYLSWRRQIANHFRNKARLDNVPECYDLTVQPQLIIDSELLTRPGFQWVVSAMVVRCHTSEARDKTAR